MNWGVVGGGLLIVIAIVWFIGGHETGSSSYYPSAIALIGAYGVLKGLGAGKWK